MEAAPVPPAPLQPIKSHERGVRLRTNPMRALITTIVSYYEIRGWEKGPEKVRRLGMSEHTMA